MDKFVKIKKQNNPLEPLFGREDLVVSLNTIVNDNDVVCVYGSVGVGKTTLVNHVIKDKRVIHLTRDMIPTKDLLVSFVERVGNERIHLVFDDFDKTYSYVIDYLKSHKRLSKGSLILITSSIAKIDFCECLLVNPLSFENLLTLGAKESSLSDEEIRIHAMKSNGDLRQFKSRLKYNSQNDTFKTPKTLMCDLLHHKENPMNLVGKWLEEYGFSCSMIHENYIDQSSLDNIVDSSESLSLADTYDTEIYKGDWDMLQYYTPAAIIKPVLNLDIPKKSCYIRNGSMWSKFSNQCMRHNKFMDMVHNAKPHTLDVSALNCLHNICRHDMELFHALIKDYNITRTGIDVMNHISLQNKLKPSAVTKIKNALGKT